MEKHNIERGKMMTTTPLILVINPGSTSTKIALYKGTEQVKELDITHQNKDLEQFNSNLEQLDFRYETVLEALEDWNVKPEELNAAIGRGGPLKPLEGGVYNVGKALMDDLQSGNLIDHASILGGLIAYKVSQKAGIPSYIADPVSVDEFEEIARISGTPELPRLSMSHALNIKAVVAEVAAEAGKKARRYELRSCTSRWRNIGCCPQKRQTGRCKQCQ